ncbi:hypothetical protein MAR_029971 [Mya arenaria]|uniref:Uncharacterized protein n=1 Tax=Mya arenaria TaxID=6604 RepID=A0ABY7DL12_MYAAR|nr:hypothetical protein MAR_029971 [Mya arenaria]
MGTQNLQKEPEKSAGMQVEQSAQSPCPPTSGKAPGVEPLNAATISFKITNCGSTQNHYLKNNLGENFNNVLRQSRTWVVKKNPKFFWRDKEAVIATVTKTREKGATEVENRLQEYEETVTEKQMTMLPFVSKEGLSKYTTPLQIDQTEKQQRDDSLRQQKGQSSYQVASKTATRTAPAQAPGPVEMEETPLTETTNEEDQAGSPVRTGSSQRMNDRISMEMQQGRVLQGNLELLLHVTSDLKFALFPGEIS